MINAVSCHAHVRPKSNSSENPTTEPKNLSANLLALQMGIFESHVTYSYHIQGDRFKTQDSIWPQLFSYRTNPSSENGASASTRKGSYGTTKSSSEVVVELPMDGFIEPFGVSAVSDGL